MISSRVGSTMSLAWLSQCASASASAASRATASCSLTVSSTVIGTTSAPSRSLTCSAEQAAAVPWGPCTTMIRVCRSRGATRIRPTTRSISPQSLVGSKTTFLPSFCHCGKYIHPCPLKGCENTAVGSPASTRRPSAGAPPPWPQRWNSRTPSASLSFAATSSTAAGGISSPPTNWTSPSLRSTPPRYSSNFAISSVGLDK